MIGMITSGASRLALVSRTAVIAALAGVCFVPFCGNALAATVLSPTAALLVDTDGDGVPNFALSGSTIYIADNAPGVANPDQADSDGDGIGNVIDPTPFTPDPLQTPGIALDPTPVLGIAGQPLVINFTLSTAPVGGFGHVRFDFNQDGTYDGYLTGPLAAGPVQTAVVDPSLFVDGAAWDLNTPGIYDFSVAVDGPGIQSRPPLVASAIISAASVPEPATLALFALGLAGIEILERRRKNA